MIRLQKFIAEHTEFSRRKAEDLISAGKVKVNGVTAEIGQSVEESDIIKLDGKTIKPKKTKKIYIALNKPKGYVTTTSDELSRKTVIDLVKNEIKEKIYPVGRLDKDTTGLLLLTNDGDFANAVINSRSKTSKEYIATINKEATPEMIKKLEAGIKIDGIQLKPCKIKKLDIKEYKIIVYEGKNRQIRKMFESFNIRVISLERIRIGKINLGNIPNGRFRHLRENEIKTFL